MTVFALLISNAIFNKSFYSRFYTIFFSYNKKINTTTFLCTFYSHCTEINIFVTKVVGILPTHKNGQNFLVVASHNGANI